MRKILIIALFVLICCGTVHAGLMFPLDAQVIYSSSDSADIEVVTTATVYTKSFYLNQGEYFAVAVLCTTEDAVDLKIELEQSFQKPETEGSADTYWSEPDGLSDIEDSITVETIKHYSFSPIALPYGRFKITGAAGNTGTTTVNMWLSKMENK